MQDKKRVNFREYILGGQDGIVNVLGLTLGVASATLSSNIVIISGIVSTVAESLSMAAVAYTSSKAAKDYTRSLISDGKNKIKNEQNLSELEIRNMYHKQGFRGHELNHLVKCTLINRKLFSKTLLKSKEISKIEFEHPLKSAWVVGISSVIGSLIPLFPFFFFPVKLSIILSLVVCALVLFVVGALKAKLSIGSWKRSGTEMMIIGIVTALIGYSVGLLLKGYGIA